MSAFDFERLDVYRVAIEFVSAAHGLIERLPRGHAYLADQLQRAATSVALNIAEGAGESKRAEKNRFYRMARRSAFECAAILDVLAAQRLSDPTETRTGRELLQRIGAMLTRMTADRAESGGGGVVRERPETEAGAEPEAEQQPDSDSGSDSGAY